MTRHRIETWLTAIGVLAIVYLLPRALTRFLGVDHPWSPYLYLYGCGFAVFWIGLRVIRASRAYQPGRGYDSLWYRILWAGFAFFATLHAVWILLALYWPWKGGG